MATDTSESPIAPGTVLDNKYRVKKALGKGGFGEVFLAEDDLVTGRTVAIKVLRDTEVEDREDFVREMNLLAKVNHPGVVTFHHHFTRGDRLFLVMAHCEAGSLRDLLHTKRYSVAEAVALVAKIAEALAFMHGRNVVHHDIKPENILFDADGQPRIGDFGVANRNWGTRAYMAPELLLGERVSPHDARIDIYALGVTLLELLTGSNPFFDLVREDNVRRKVAHEFVPPHLDRWLQEMILKATHPTPELRFQTADEFRSALAAKHVPFVVDRANIEAHDLALKAEKLAQRKRWDAARKCLDLALHKKPDCVAARVVAGRIALLREDLGEARRHLLEAQKLNPRANIQKELGWIHLAVGEYPLAISMLTDYLQRNATDHEAHNLLLQCFYLTDRYEAGARIANLMTDLRSTNHCFENNLFICNALHGLADSNYIDGFRAASEGNPFLRYNIALLTEKPRAWDDRGRITLKSKVLFQDFRFGEAEHKIRSHELMFENETFKYASMRPLITIGRYDTNEIQFDALSLSRRHAVIVNWHHDVWIYDLGSTRGSFLNGEPVRGRRLLGGAPDIRIGDKTLTVRSRDGLLL